MDGGTSVCDDETLTHHTTSRCMVANVLVPKACVVQSECVCGPKLREVCFGLRGGAEATLMSAGGRDTGRRVRCIVLQQMIFPRICECWR
jgi:hypothetical protein